MNTEEKERVMGYVKVLDAYLDGKTIQYSPTGEIFSDVKSDQPPFNFAFGKYRVKPERRIVNIKTSESDEVIGRYKTRWTAWDEDTYDGAPDGNNTLGWGKTEQEAINDLLEQLDELNS